MEMRGVVDVLAYTCILLFEKSNCLPAIENHPQISQSTQIEEKSGEICGYFWRFE